MVAKRRWTGVLAAAFAVVAVCLGQSSPGADEKQPAAPAPPKSPEEKLDLKRLTKEHEVYIDIQRKLVAVDGVVCLREGLLELFACPKGGKDHESIVALNCTPEEVHAALIAVGAKPGAPASYDNSVEPVKYTPATGDIIEILVQWTTPDGKSHQTRAQNWIKQRVNGKPMDYDWVFAGSRFTRDAEGKLRYMASLTGDFICVSNFTTATLDLPVKSGDSNDSLLFDAFTEKIPERGTKIRLLLYARPTAAPAGEKPAAKPAESGK